MQVKASEMLIKEFPYRDGNRFLNEAQTNLGFQPFEVVYIIGQWVSNRLPWNQRFCDQSLGLLQREWAAMVGLGSWLYISSHGPWTQG